MKEGAPNEHGAYLEKGMTEKRGNNGDYSMIEWIAKGLPENVRYVQFYQANITNSDKKNWRARVNGFRAEYKNAMKAAVERFDVGTLPAAGESLDGVITELTLPAQHEGYQIIWESSDPEVLRIEAGKAIADDSKFTAYSHELTLTAKFENPDYDGGLIPQYMERSYQVTVLRFHLRL